MVRTTVFLDPKLKAGMERQARLRRTSFSKELREAMALYLEAGGKEELELLAKLAPEANRAADHALATLDRTHKTVTRMLKRIHKMLNKNSHDLAR